MDKPVGSGCSTWGNRKFDATRRQRPVLALESTGAGLMLAASSSFAQIIWGGEVNLAIPTTSNGLYLNVLTGAVNEPGNTGNTGGTSVPGWDVNPYGPSGLSFWSATPKASSGYTPVLALGDPIGASFTTGITTPPASAWNLNSTDNYIGLRFLNEGGGTVHYGWMQIGLEDTTTTGRTLVSYAFESSPLTTIQAGVVPEPGTYAMMGLGLAGLLLAVRRRKQQC